MSWDYKAVAAWLLGILGFLVAFIFRDVWKRLHNLEQNSVSKSDLRALEERLSIERRQLHEENRGRLDRIEAQTALVLGQLFVIASGREKSD